MGVTQGVSLPCHPLLSRRFASQTQSKHHPHREGTNELGEARMGTTHDRRA